MMILAHFGDENYRKDEGMTKLSIGVDIGTTSTKAVIFDDQGQERGKSQKAYPLLTPNTETAEQNPEDIVLAVMHTLTETIEKAQTLGTLSHIAFSAQMHSLLLVDKNMQPLTKSITWADNRAKTIAKRYKHTDKGATLYYNTGTPIHAMSPFCKLIWIKEHQPEIFNQAYKVIDIKTFVIFHLTQKCVMDMSIASSTGLFNIHHKKWDAEALEQIGIDEMSLPKVVSTLHVLSMEPEITQKLHLTSSVPLIIGASDGVLSNLGVDSFRPGEIAVTIGTSGAIRTVVNTPQLDPKGRTFCYILDENHYVIGGPVNNGAVTLQWLREQILQRQSIHEDEKVNLSYDQMFNMAEAIQPGADGLIFQPYLSGERAPIWSSNARGAFIGFTLAHHQGHMIRAVLEGVLYNLYSVLMTLTEMTGTLPKTIKATGGFSRNPLWRQIMADIFDCEVVIPKSYESSCLGAITLGFKALGDERAYDYLPNWIGSVNRHEPNEEAVQQYRILSSIFMEMTQNLMTTYERITAYQNQNK